ncbi:hypothetical protein LINGRAHAP2_LOCUS20565 [Linum grandiflorum]
MIMNQFPKFCHGILLQADYQGDTPICAHWQEVSFSFIQFGRADQDRTPQPEISTMKRKLNPTYDLQVGGLTSPRDLHHAHWVTRVLQVIYS